MMISLPGYTALQSSGVLLPEKGKMQEEAAKKSTLPVTPTQEVNGPAHSVGPRRKGLGVRLRQKQAFTEKKNIQGKQMIKQRIADELKDLHIDLSIDDEFLKTLTATEEVNRPPLEVTLGLSVLDDLCHETVHYMDMYIIV